MRSGISCSFWEAGTWSVLSSKDTVSSKGLRQVGLRQCSLNYLMNEWSLILKITLWGRFILLTHDTDEDSGTERRRLLPRVHVGAELGSIPGLCVRICTRVGMEEAESDTQAGAQVPHSHDQHLATQSTSESTHPVPSSLCLGYF